MTMPEPEKEQDRRKAEDREPMTSNLGALGLVMQLGFIIAGPIALCTLAGYYLEQRYGGGPGVVLAGILIGLVSGIFGGYRVVKPYLN